ncbi:muts domain V-domain-containing protein, partial [Collybia nuda]
LAREIFDNLSKFPHCLLLTKVGQFYESYFDQAIELSRLLKIKLTSRKWDNCRVPMCGFPLVHLDKHLKVLVQQNKRFVAMCEEFPRSSSLGTKEFDRRVVRVVTPGTLIDEPFLDPYENNYLLAVSTPEISEPTRDISSVGLAWIDVSTGEFFAKVTTLDEIRDELARISPREVVLDKRMESIKDHPVFRALAEDNNFVSYITPSSFITTEKKISPTPSATPWADVDSPKHTDTSEASAIKLLTSYLSANLLDHMPVLSSPRREGSKPHMEIDSHTIKALEIRERVWEGGTKGSLLAVMKRTLTYGGSRLLARWLCSPSTSIVEIYARQSLVAFFHTRPHFHADIAELVAEVEDIKRITQKLILGRGNVGDLLAVNKTIRAWANIFNRISEEREMEARERNEYNPSDWGSLDALMSRMTGLDELSKRIGTALDDVTKGEYQVAGENEHNMIEENEVTLSDDATNGFWRPGNGKWIIKPQFSTKLETLHLTLRDLVEKKKQLERHLQLQYDAPSLTLRASPGQGIHVHVTKAKRDQSKRLASPEFITIAESGSTRSFFYKEWSQLATIITENAVSLSTAEKEAFETLRDEVSSRAQTLCYNSQVLDELDVALSFASVATEMNFVRPTLVEDTVYDITNGRHPCVELGLLRAGRVFTPNSVRLSQKTKLQFITGPNMGGKSTLLRQTALIAILAQTGSFVPADSAFIGIVDKVFSRVGAKDDLFHDRSTFMVEMLETAQILRKATSKSLVIMDEVGRGTTTRDGIAIAFATLHHLVTRNKCRTLFATHFHELATMMGYPDNQTIFQSVDFFYTSDDHFAYSYRVQPGINRDSHGLKVAQLAGMPSAALNVAQEILSQMRG